MIEVEFRHGPGCPHTDAARALLQECLTELKLDVAVEDKEGGVDPLWWTPYGLTATVLRITSCAAA